MNSFTRSLLALAGLVAMGASPESHSARATGIRHSRPSFVDRTFKDHFAPNAIRRARLSYLMPKNATSRRIGAHVEGGASQAAASAYKVINLDALIQSPGVKINPLALNNAGQVVGSSTASIGSGGYVGYIVNPSGASGPLYDATSYCCFFDDYPVSISNNGQSVAGFGYFEVVEPPGTNDTTISSLFWTLTGPIVNTLALNFYQGGGFSSVADQNIAVAGDTYNTAQSGGALSNPSCEIADLNATGINDSGLIVGSRIDRGGAIVLTLGGCPTAVPNGGQYQIADVVASNGNMILQDGLKSALWSKGRVFPIPLPTGYDTSKYIADAIALNASDVVVGNVVDENGTPAGAFAYANGKSVDIQTLFPPNSGWMPPFYVTGINDGAEIIGEGHLNNVSTAFALVK